MSEPTGVHEALVQDLSDPTGQGRARLLIPAVLGQAVSAWANPVLSKNSISSTKVGDRVWAMFQDGDISCPTWLSLLDLSKYYTKTDSDTRYALAGHTHSALVAYPVGAIFLSVVNTSPDTLFGGTWAVFGTGQVLVGVDTTQTEFNTVMKTGGAKTHTLTVAEMPAHAHIHNAHNHTQNAHAHALSDPGHAHAVGIGYAEGINVANWTLGNSADGQRAFTVYNDTVTAANTTGIAVFNATPTNNATTATEQNAGGGGAHNNLQPFVTCYMWRRTA